MPPTLAEALAVDGVREAMVLSGQLSALDLLVLRRVSAPLRAFAAAALADCPPLAVLGALEDGPESPLPRRRQAEPSQLALLADEDGGVADDDDDFEPSDEDEDDDGASDVAASDTEASSSEEEEGGEGAAGGGGGQPSLRLRGLVMCWSSGRWAAAPAMDCCSPAPPTAEHHAEPCRVLCPMPALKTWPPRRECLVLPHPCDWAADYSLDLAPGAAAAQRIGTSLQHAGRGSRADGAAVLCGRMPTRREPGAEQAQGGRCLFLLGGYYEPPSESESDSEEEEEEEQEEGHSALVEYFPIDAPHTTPAFPVNSDETVYRRWTPFPAMEHQRTEFAAGFFPQGSAFAQALTRRQAAFDLATSGGAAALIVAGGSDGSNEEYHCAAECLLFWPNIIDGRELSCSGWESLPAMQHPRGYSLPRSTFLDLVSFRSREFLREQVLHRLRAAGRPIRRGGRALPPQHRAGEAARRRGVLPAVLALAEPAAAARAVRREPGAEPLRGGALAAGGDDGRAGGDWREALRRGAAAGAAAGQNRAGARWRSSCRWLGASLGGGSGGGGAMGAAGRLAAGRRRGGRVAGLPLKAVMETQMLAAFGHRCPRAQQHKKTCTAHSRLPLLCTFGAGARCVPCPGWWTTCLARISLLTLADVDEEWLCCLRADLPILASRGAAKIGLMATAASAGDGTASSSGSAGCLVDLDGMVVQLSSSSSSSSSSAFLGARRAASGRPRRLMRLPPTICTARDGLDGRFFFAAPVLCCSSPSTASSTSSAANGLE